MRMRGLQNTVVGEGEARAAPMATDNCALIPGHGAGGISREGDRVLEEQVGRVLDGGIEWEWPMADGFGRRVVDLRWYEREEKKRGREQRDPWWGVVELTGDSVSTTAHAHHVLHLLLLLPCHHNSTQVRGQRPLAWLGGGRMGG